MTDAGGGPDPDLDLDACAAEPIHVPGAIQPHGVLLAVEETSLRVVRASANAADLLGRRLDDVLGARLPDLVRGLEVAGASAEALLAANPVPVTTAAGDADAIVHRSGGLLVVELEPAGDRAQVALATSFHAVRGTLERLQSATTVDELVALTASGVRDLTGFDRVMVYRFDEAWNGEVVAEERAAHLEPFLHLWYPESDIPAQARALYTTNWLRLIVDRGYTPVPLLPDATDVHGQPLDLSRSVLRSVSPVHLEYLRNMGVAASMSVSLLERGRLWGLVSCHHSTPHRPPLPVRAAAELLGRTVSLVLPTLVEGDRHRRAAAVREVEARLVERLDATEDVADALRAGGELLELTASTGAAMRIGGRLATVGAVPPPAALEAIVGALLPSAAEGEVVAVDALADVDGALGCWPDVAAGALAVALGERGAAGDWVLCLRPEVVRTVTWGGDPRDKVRHEGDRLAPRASFAAWTETVVGRAEAWRDEDREAAGRLARHLARVLLRRAQLGARVAAELKRVLLVETLPSIPGADVRVRYRPAADDLVGGDWYDVFWLPDGRVAVAVGDVAGHGMAAAPVMAHLRHALRAYLLKDPDPGLALGRVNDLANALLPWDLATAVVADLDPSSGRLRVASAGHLPGIVVDDGGARLLDVPVGVALGAVPSARYATAELRLPAGATALLFTDGLVERRGEQIDVGLERLRAAAATAPDELDAACDHLVAVADTTDDVTLLALRLD